MLAKLDLYSTITPRGIKMKKLLLSLTIASLLSVSSYAMSAKDDQHQKRGDSERRLMSSLSLSDQQKQDIEQIRKESKQDMSVYRVEQQQIRENMRSIMQAGVWDEAAVTAAIEQQMTLGLQTRLIKAKSQNKVFNQLSSEQQAQFIAKRVDKMTEKHEKSGKMAKREDKKMARLVKALDLNAEQQASLSAMMQNNKEQRKANQALRESVRMQITELVQASEFDENAWLAIHDQNKPQALAMAVAKAKSRFDMLSILDVEQREKFSKIMQKSKKGKMNKKSDKRKGRPESEDS